MSRLQHSGLMRAVGDAEVVQELRRIRRKRKNRKSQSKAGKAKRTMVVQLGLENERLRQAQIRTSPGQCNQLYLLDPGDF